MNLLTIRPGYWLTPIIVYINTAIFLFVVLYTQSIFLFPSQALAELGGNVWILTINGQWWRLLTSVFLHGGLMHLLLNSIVLMNIGIFLEPVLGRISFAVVYLLTGIIASAASLLVNYGGGYVVSIGASGAIFGMYGFFLALLTTNLFRPKFRKVFLQNTLVFVGLNIAIGFFGFLGPIDNAAHIGGLASGFILGYLWLPLVRRRARLKATAPKPG